MGLSGMESSPKTESEHILIVDDEAVIREVLTDFLEENGDFCYVASNADEALGSLTENPITLVISDIKMLGMDGIELMKVAKQSFPDLDFMIMTGYAADYTYTNIINAGAADFMIKPFKLEELKAKMARIRRERRLLIDLKEGNAALELAMEKANLMSIKAETANLELDQIFDRSTSGIWVIDSQFEILRMNRTLSDLSGKGKGKVRGLKCYDVFPISLCGSRDCPLTRIMNGDGFFECDMEKRDPEGPRISFLLTATSFFGLDGELMGIVSEFKDITSRRQAEVALEKANRELRRLSVLDDLTQVANRRRFDETLNEEWQRLCRNRAPLSLIFCDIDYFKLYNDTYGHQAGDDCLRAVADTISVNCQRPGDFVARYGGEEFIVILPNTEAEGAVHLAEDIREEIERLKIPHMRSQVSRYITLSLGVSSVFPSADIIPESLVGVADKALYEAKNQGRNRTVLKVADNEGMP
ncbi:MAG: diguanylate cyclase [Deltaproteobacteria bacterium]|nr:diguanylate cyclase [Deltaproteobacteria bacterium]